MLKDNWSMCLTLPPEKREGFFQQALMGEVSAKEHNQYINVIMFCQERSGSKHTHTLLHRALGLYSHPIGFQLKNGDLYYPRVLASKFLNKNTISRCHTHNSPDIARIIRNLDIRPLVLTRQLLDTLVSRRDNVLKTDPGTDILSEREWVKFIRGNNEYQLDVVIEKYAGLHIEFFASWEAYTGDVLRITWDEMVSDIVGMVDRVAKWSGLEVVKDVGQITENIKATGGIALNKGIAGRGRELFNDRQIDEIMKRAEILGCSDDGFLQ